MLAGARGELADRGGSAPDYLGDLGAGHAEHILQHERGAFGGRERLEDHQQRGGDAFVLGDTVGGIVPGSDLRFRQPLADVLFAAGARGPELVQGEAADDGGEPGAQVVDLVGLARFELSLQAQPGVLHHILGVGEAAERAVGESTQVRAMFLEAAGQFGLIERLR